MNYFDSTAQTVTSAVAFGVTVDKKKINLAQPIKAVGTKTVEVKLHPKVTAEVTVCTVESK